MLAQACVAAPHPDPLPNMQEASLRDEVKDDGERERSGPAEDAAEDRVDVGEVVVEVEQGREFCGL